MRTRGPLVVDERLHQPAVDVEDAQPDMPRGGQRIADRGVTASGIR